jgi:hypothetical protein
MKNLETEMNEKLMESIADIAYHFGERSYFSGDSRADTITIIHLAKEFEAQEFDWEKDDYITEIKNFTYSKIDELLAGNHLN